MSQPHEVRLADGKRIDWNHPPKSNTMCRWTKRTTLGKPIKGSLRTLAHLNRLNNLALNKYDQQVVILQGPWNTSVRASAGTHDFDAVWDLYIPGVAWWDQQRFFRSKGLGCWYRHPPQWGNHIHGITLPPRRAITHDGDFAAAGLKVGRFVPAQVDDYYHHALGLAGQHVKGSDKSWFPPSIEATVFDLGAYVARRAT